MPATLEDVARIAGVSIATASRVFNARPNVAESTRAAVVAAIERLGYGGQPNLAANRHTLVGVLLSDPDSTLFVNIVRSLVEALAANGVSVVVLHYAATASAEEQAIEILLERRLSGIAILSGQQSAIDLALPPYSSLRRGSMGMPEADDADDSSPGASISWDDSVAISLATDRLRADGHTSIGYLARVEDWASVKRKIAVFESIMSSASGRRGHTERANSTIESADLATRRVLDSGVTAIVTETDWMAIGALRAVKAAGLRVPEDVALISSEDSRVLAELDPPVTAVRQPADALGRAAAFELTRQLEGSAAQAGEQVFRPEIITRGSVSRRTEDLSVLVQARAQAGLSPAGV